MTEVTFVLGARVSTESPEAIRPILIELVPGGYVQPSGARYDLLVEGQLRGASARILNRGLLTAFRRLEQRTRLRSEWTCERRTERVSDCLPKGTQAVSPDSPRTPRMR